MAMMSKACRTQVSRPHKTSRYASGGLLVVGGGGGGTLVAGAAGGAIKSGNLG